MSDTLDRLKALNDRLEKKLQAKTHGRSKEEEESDLALMERPPSQRVTASTPRQSETPPISSVTDRRSKTEKRSAVPSIPEEKKSSETAREEERLLHRRLLGFLKIDADLEPVRSENLRRLSELFAELNIEKKVRHIEDIFIYKAMNISGIGLREEDFGEIREGKYVQVIAITYEPDKNGKKKAKNVSLGYFGKAETLDNVRKNEVIEFVLRWRYEKAFQNLEHYKLLLDKVKPIDSLD